MKRPLALFNLILLLIINQTFASCSAGDANTKVATGNECKCALSDAEMAQQFPISSKNDSVILCRKGSINGLDWTAFLSKKVLNDYFAIYNCQTGKYIKSKYPDISVTYSDKSLILFSHKEFIAYDTTNEKWIGKLQMDIYKERVYAMNGNIQKSEPEFIFTPPKLSRKAIKEIDSMFDMKIKSLGNINSNSLVEYLLIGALNGDLKSKERLENFQTLVPKGLSDKQENNPDNLAPSLEILHDFEKYKLNNEVQYLDLTKYEIGRAHV